MLFRGWPSLASQQASSIQTAQSVIAALRAAGVTQFVLCPGSRSAPLAYALQLLIAAGPPSRSAMHVRLDERGAGFYALGLAKASQLPVAIIVTSGTAVANLHPAVLEADLARVPLIVLTADRPARLRGKLASQTVNQVCFFGSAVRWAADLPTGIEPSEAYQLGAAAVAQAGNPAFPGPVQLNIQFDDPLYPTTPITADADGCRRRSESSLETSQTSAVKGCLGPSESGLNTAQRPAGAPYLPGDPSQTLVLAGDDAGPAARMLAEAQGWPLVAEPTSGTLGSPNAVIGSRYLLPLLGAEIQQAIVFGRPTLSRQVMALLARPDVAVTVVAPGAGPWPDAWRNTARVIGGIEADFLAASRAGKEVPLESRVLAQWQGAAKMAGAIIADALATAARVSESSESSESAIPGNHALNPSKNTINPLVVAREVATAHFAKPGHLVVGASNPIRDLDLVVELAASAYQQSTALAVTNPISANRGVAGIDGTIATALGIAAANDDPNSSNRLYLGDLAFWHDSSSLIATAGENRPQLQIIVANDAGGSIFSNLEHGQWAAQSAANATWFERVFATPQQGDIALLCAAHAVPYTQVSDVQTLQRALNSPKATLEVIEVKVDRQARRAFSAALGNEIASAFRLA